jgi:hypothetical protein
VKTKSLVEFDIAKNRIYLVMEGSHDVEEARRLKEAYREATLVLKPGFTVLSDVSRYIPGSEEVQKVHAEVARIAKQAGVGKVARVIGEKPLGGMQIKRITKHSGGYESKNFVTREEAEDYLDE